MVRIRSDPSGKTTSKTFKVSTANTAGTLTMVPNALLLDTPCTKHTGSKYTGTKYTVY